MRQRPLRKGSLEVNTTLRTEAYEITSGAAGPSVLEREAERPWNLTARREVNLQGKMDRDLGNSRGRSNGRFVDQREITSLRRTLDIEVKKVESHIYFPLTDLFSPTKEW